MSTTLHFFDKMGVMDTQKFLADIQKIKKHDRADNGGHYDGKRVCEQIAKLFTNNNRHLANLGHEVSDYWLSTYIFNSNDIANEPTEPNTTKLLEFQMFLDGEDDEYQNITNDDWENLRDFVDGEAEELDLESLQNMMSIILDKGAL